MLRERSDLSPSNHVVHTLDGEEGTVQLTPIDVDRVYVTAIDDTRVFADARLDVFTK